VLKRAGNRGEMMPFGWFLSIVLASLAFAVAPVRAEEPRLAISGYDPVAYFTDGKPVPGQNQHDYVWHNARWRFASAEHRDLFASDPERYAPQYDGYCAMGVTGVAVAAPHKDTVDPEAWTIVEGKLYLTHTKRSLELWREQATENVKQANEHWQFVKDQVDPTIVGLPCRARPPTVVVNTSKGKRVLIVGGQSALDSDGHIVGKGDIRAQLEQVGKNVDACLKAVGAAKSDIILSRTYVTDLNMFKQYANVRDQYLGPETKGSMTLETPKLAEPDSLVEIEVLAALN
jgi:enamine deaminase RidA (YjgF/YER057c/UK114 family)